MLPRLYMSFIEKNKSVWLPYKGQFASYALWRLSFGMPFGYDKWE